KVTKRQVSQASAFFEPAAKLSERAEGFAITPDEEIKVRMVITGLSPELFHSQLAGHLFGAHVHGFALLESVDSSEVVSDVQIDLCQGLPVSGRFEDARGG